MESVAVMHKYYWFKIFFLINPLQYIPRNMHTVFALLCFVVVIHWLIFPYPSGLLHWHCGNLTIAPVPAKQPWWIWINTSCEFITNDCITTTKQSTTKPCAYFLGYIVPTRSLWRGRLQNQSITSCCHNNTKKFIYGYFAGGVDICFLHQVCLCYRVIHRYWQFNWYRGISENLLIANETRILSNWSWFCMNLNNYFGNWQYVSAINSTWIKEIPVRLPRLKQNI